MGVRWPILALVGVGRARKRPGERFGTVVDGVDFGSFQIFEKCVQKHMHFWRISAVKNMISYLNLYEPKPSSKDLRGVQFSRVKLFHYIS